MLRNFCIFVVAFHLLSIAPANAWEENRTPGSTDAWAFMPCAWTWTQTFSTMIQVVDDYGYVPVEVTQWSQPGAPHADTDVWFEDFIVVLTNGAQTENGNGAGIIGFACHGWDDGLMVTYYPATDAGKQSMRDDYNRLKSSYSVDTVSTVDGYAIKALSGGIRSKYITAPNNSALLHVGACRGGSWGNNTWNGKARTWFEYHIDPYIYMVNNDANQTWEALKGACGVDLTQAGRAVEQAPSHYLWCGGSPATVIKPFVSRASPREGSVISSPTEGVFTFNCVMNTALTWGVLSATGFSVSGVYWKSDSTLAYTMTPGYGDGEITVVGAYCMSVGGITLRSDYDAYYCSAQFCDINRAAGFEGAWAWQSGNEDSVIFVTTVEAGTDSLRLEGFRPGEDIPQPCLTMPAHGRPWLYSVAVPHGRYDRYQVVEIINGEEAERSLGFSVSQGPPENLAALRATTLPWPPPVNTPFGGTDGRASPPRPAHFVAYSSSSSLMSALQSVWDTLAVKFHWTVNTVVGGKSAAACQNAFSAQWQANLNAGWPPPRCVVVGESNEDTTSVHNIVSMQQVTDGTGDCYYGSCANPGWWVDFFNNGTGQCPLYRLPVSTVAEAQNYAQAWQKYIAGYAQAQRTLYLDVGDRTGYTVVPSFRILSEQVIAPLYSAAGYVITEHLESSFPIGLYGAARDSGRAVFNRKGALEMVSRGLVTNRSQLGAKTIQVAYDSPWTNVAVPQQCIGWWLTCDEGDDQRINAGYYPALVKRFLTANPDSYAVFVAIAAYTRGGYGAHQDTIAVYLMNERWGGQATDIGDVVWRAAQNLWSTHPEVQADLYRLSVSGLPVPLPGSASLTGVDEPAQRSGVARLWKPFPNPGNTATINFSLVVSGRNTLNVYDVSGRLVRTLVDQDRLPGYYSARWDGRDGEQKLVPSGVYFVRLDAGTTSVSERMVLLR